MSTKQLYRFTAKAGPWVAGYRRDPAADTISLTPEEAELDLLAGTIVPDGAAVTPVTPPGAILSMDRILALRGGKGWDFSVAELAAFLVASDLGDELRGALRGGVASERDTLAKLSAALDAAVVLLRAAIQARAPASALADKADAGTNRNITELAGLTTPLSVLRGGTGSRTAGDARAALGLPLVPDDPLFAQAMEALWIAWIATLPVWDGVGSAPVRVGKPFLQGPGGPVLIAQPPQQ